MGQLPHLSVHQITRKYGDVCGIKLGNVFTVFISHPQLLNEAFSKTTVSDRWMGEIMGALSGGGADMVFMNYGDQWRQMRRYANHDLFNTKRLAQIRVEHMEQVVAELVDDLKRCAAEHETCEPSILIPESNAELIFRCCFGLPQEREEGFAESRKALLDITFWAFENASATNPADYLPLLSFLPNNAVGKAQEVAADRDRLIDDLIDTVRQRPGRNANAPTCLLDVMLAKQELGEVDQPTVRYMMGDMLAAGIDTTAQTLAWTLLLVANRPAVQQRIHEEIDAIAPGEEPPDYAKRGELPYLEAVLLESMRYRTIGPFAVPHKAVEDTEIDGFRIPAGSQVLANVYSIHNDPRFWDRPDQFIPQRHIGVEKSERKKYSTLVPFSVGRRQCPGQNFAMISMWLHLTRIFHGFQLSPSSSGLLPEDEVFGLTVSPKPYKLTVTARH
ncbi:MAG: cytochrome P450 [Pseudomonadota bacterium]